MTKAVKRLTKDEFRKEATQELLKLKELAEVLNQMIETMARGNQQGGDVTFTALECATQVKDRLKSCNGSAQRISQLIRQRIQSRAREI